MKVFLIKLGFRFVTKIRQRKSYSYGFKENGRNLISTQRIFFKLCMLSVYLFVCNRTYRASTCDPDVNFIFSYEEVVSVFLDSLATKVLESNGFQCLIWNLLIRALNFEKKNYFEFFCIFSKFWIWKFIFPKMFPKTTSLKNKINKEMYGFTKRYSLAFLCYRCYLIILFVIKSIF